MGCVSTSDQRKSLDGNDEEILNLNARFHRNSEPEMDEKNTYREFSVYNIKTKKKTFITL